MTEKPKATTVTLSGVTLFRDDIEVLASMLSRRLGGVHIETDRFERMKGEEFFAQSIETKPTGMQLTDSDRWSSNFCLTLGRRGAETTARDARETDALLHEVTRYLRDRQSWLALYWESSSAQWAACVLVVGLASLLVWVRHERWWVVTAGLVPFAALLNACVGMMAVSDRHSRAVITMDKTRKDARFWQRNRDLLLVLVSGGFVLAAAALPAFLPG